MTRPGNIPHPAPIERFRRRSGPAVVVVVQPPEQRVVTIAPPLDATRIIIRRTAPP